MQIRVFGFNQPGGVATPYLCVLQAAAASASPSAAGIDQLVRLELR